MQLWIVFAGFATALATGAVAFVAWRELHLLRMRLETDRENQKQWATVTACERYDTEVSLYLMKRRIRRYWDESSQTYREPEKIRRDVINLLNCLDSIAIGIKQKIYIEHIARDHLENIIEEAVGRFIYTKPRGCFCDEDNYPCLIWLYKEWFPAPDKTHYEAPK